MNLIGKKVEVVSGYYKEAEGTVVGMTVDGYFLVTPSSKNSFFAKASELIVIT